ncbi:unnamed protein product [Oikopleura dioica]|uniref:Uncharacterized protein n=1 Tax=Oikopleura dioica TaxID=34765 RepID=E4WZ50_OIKDI|nr:unnamed protein product [Oikopleura dioica]
MSHSAPCRARSTCRQSCSLRSSSAPPSLTPSLKVTSRGSRKLETLFRRTRLLAKSKPTRHPCLSMLQLLVLSPSSLLKMEKPSLSRNSSLRDGRRRRRPRTKEGSCARQKRGSSRRRCSSSCSDPNRRPSSYCYSNSTHFHHKDRRCQANASS